MLATEHEPIRRAERAEGVLQRAWAAAVEGTGYPAAAAVIDGVTVVDKGSDWVWSRAFAAGLDGPISESTVEKIERWFGDRGEHAKPAKIDLNPIADQSLPEILGRRGYRPAFWDSVLLRDASTDDLPKVKGVDIEPVARDAARAWGKLLRDAFSEGGPPEDLHDRMPEKLAGFVGAEGAVCLVARVDDEPVGGALVGIVPDEHGSVALLHAAGTLPEFRSRGVQHALTAERIRIAAKAGCDLIAAQSDPRNEASLRNLQRMGFRVGLSRVAMEARGVRG